MDNEIYDYDKRSFTVGFYDGLAHMGFRGSITDLGRMMKMRDAAWDDLQSRLRTRNDPEAAIKAHLTLVTKDGEEV